MADIDNCDGSNFLRRACDAGTGGGGGGGGSEFNQSLTNGDGIGILDYDGSVAKTITVNSSVVRNTTDQLIAGGLTIEKLTSNGPITGQGLDISGIFSVGGDGSIGGSSPAATDVIAWNGAKWAPATAGGAASSSNLDLGYALNQSLRTSDEGQLSKLDVTGVTGLLSSGNVGIGITNPAAPLHVIGNISASQTTGVAAEMTLTYQSVGGSTGSQLRLIDNSSNVGALLQSNGVSYLTGGSLGVGTNSPLDYDGESDNLVVYDPSHCGITIATPDTSARGHLFFADGTVGSNRYKGGVSYDHSSDTLSLRAGSVSSVYLSGGNVGIGTATPSGALHVEGTGGDDVIFKTSTATDLNVGLMAGDTSRFDLKVRDEDARLDIDTDSATIISFRESGVGIGTTNPVSALELAGADTINARLTFSQTTTSKSGTIQQGSAGVGISALGDDNPIFLQTNGVQVLNVSSGHKVGIGTTDPSTSLNIVTSSDNDGILLQNPGYPTARLFNDGTDAIGRLALYHSGNTYLNIKSPGSHTSGITLGLGHTAEFINRLGETNATLAVQCSGFGHTGINVLNGAHNKRVFYVTNEGEAGLGHVGPGRGLLVTSGGNVGIGTTSPESANSEAQNVVISGTGIGVGMTVLSATGSRGNLYFADGTAGWMGYGGAISYDHAIDDLSFRTVGTERIWIKNDGNVGIGTADPSSLLHLVGTTNPEIRITDTDPGSAAAATFRAEDSSVTLGSYSNNPLYLVANNTTQMTVLSDGNVGIGTAAPQSQLNVAGSSSSSNGSQLRLSQEDAVNKQFNIGYHTGAPATQNVDYGKIEVYNGSEPGGAKYMPLSLQSAGGSVVIGSTISKGLLGVSGDTYSQRVFLTGAGGSWGQLGGETLSQGDGISAFSFDALGAGALTVGVDSSVLRTGDVEQTIHGDRTFTGTITIGNLNVTGSQNIVTTNQLVSNGPTFTLNTGVGVGVNSYDIGWVGQRGSSLNVAVLWKEDQDQFELINTDGISGGAAYPDFAVSGYEGLKVSNLKSTGKVFVKTEVAKGDLSVSGSTYSQDIYTTGAGGSWERISSINDQSTSFNTALSAGSAVYTINFPKTFGAAPVVNASLQNSAGGAIVPHMISGVGTSSYSVIFGSALGDSNYSINTSARPSGITTDGTVTQSFSTALTEGVTTQTISYPSSFGATPYVNVTIEGSGSIVPYYISGVSTTNYDVVFGAPIPANNKIHTFAVR